MIVVWMITLGLLGSANYRWSVGFIISLRTVSHLLTKIIGEDLGGLGGMVLEVVGDFKKKLVLPMMNAASASYSITPS